MAIGASEETFWTEFLAAGPARAARREAGDLRRPQGPEGRRDPDPRRHLAKAAPSPDLLAHAGRQGRRVVSAFVATAFAQEDADSAKVQWRQVADQLRPKVARRPDGRSRARRPRLHELPQGAPPEVAFDQPDRTLHAEVKRRTNVAASFPTKTPSHVVGAILLEQNDEWAVSRRS